MYTIATIGLEIWYEPVSENHHQSDPAAVSNRIDSISCYFHMNDYFVLSMGYIVSINFYDYISLLVNSW